MSENPPAHLDNIEIERNFLQELNDSIASLSPVTSDELSLEVPNCHNQATQFVVINKTGFHLINSPGNRVPARNDGGSSSSSSRGTLVTSSSSVGSVGSSSSMPPYTLLTQPHGVPPPQSAEDLQEGKVLLASGGQASVFHCRDRRTGLPYALREITLYGRSSEEALNDAKRHAKSFLLGLHTHPNLVTPIQMFYESPKLSLVLEYMDVGTLQDLLRVTGPLPLKSLAYISHQFLTALDYLRSPGHILHRDMKPANILVNSQGGVKIGDVGIAVYLPNTDHRVDTVFGPNVFKSPERIKATKQGEPGSSVVRNYESNSESGYGHKGDIWSLGLVVGLAAVGVLPLYYKDADSIVLVNPFVYNDHNDPGLQETNGYFLPYVTSEANFRVDLPFLVREYMIYHRLAVAGTPDPNFHPAKPVLCVGMDGGILPVVEDFVAQCLTWSEARRPASNELLDHLLFKENMETREGFRQWLKRELVQCRDPATLGTQEQQQQPPAPHLTPFSTLIFHGDEEVSKRPTLVGASVLRVVSTSVPPPAPASNSSTVSASSTTTGSRSSDPQAQPANSSQRTFALKSFLGAPQVQVPSSEQTTSQAGSGTPYETDLGATSQVQVASSEQNTPHAGRGVLYEADLQDLWKITRKLRETKKLKEEEDAARKREERRLRALGKLEELPPSKVNSFYRHLVPTLQVYHGYDQLHLLNEYEEYGSLKDILSKPGGLVLPEGILGMIMLQVLRGLNFLHHDCQLAHGNLQLSNILFSTSGRVLLSDYGYPPHWLMGFRPAPVGPVRGTENTPPESDEAILQRRSREDIYRVGTIVVYCAVGKPPPYRATSPRAFVSSRPQNQLVADFVKSCTEDPSLSSFELMKLDLVAPHVKVAEKQVMESMVSWLLKPPPPAPPATAAV